MQRPRFVGSTLTLLFIACCGSGCSTVPYTYGKAGTESAIPLQSDELQVERGRPNAFLDVVGWVWGIPSKIILLNMRMDNHSIGPETEKAIAEYLAANHLDDVKVRINQWAPGGEWSRWHRNRSIGFGWKYTFGVLDMLFYTLLPGRIFGGDNYNPYSDTINIYSDHEAVAIHEGGHAKDFAARTYKGTYATLYMLPFFALYPEAIASGDAISYMKECGTAEEEKRAFCILYPAYFTYIGGNVTSYVLPYDWIYFALVVPGHVAGRVKAAHVDEDRQKRQNKGPEDTRNK